MVFEHMTGRSVAPCCATTGQRKTATSDEGETPRVYTCDKLIMPLITSVSSR